MLRKYPHAPHPFVIEPPCDQRQAYEAGEELRFGLVLIGRALDYLPYFICAFDELGRNPSLPDELRVSLADRLSANERAEAEGDEEGARGRAESVLRTVLSRVEPDGRRADAPLYHELTAMSLNRRELMPNREASASVEAYRNLWEAFTREMVRVPRGDLSTLLAILRKFTWAIPSDTRRNIIPDVSLYDHLKTTAAITACLMREELSERELQRLLTALGQLFKKGPLTPYALS